MTTMADFLDDVRLAVQDDILDANDDYKIPDSLMLRFTNFALDWAANRHPVQGSHEIAVTSRVATLPGGTSRILGVFTLDGELEEVRSVYPKPDEYVLLGETLKVGSDSLASVAVSVLGEYNRAVINGNLPVPTWLEEPVYSYTVSRALSHLAVASGDVSQWNTRTDSGNPEHNPLLQLANHYEGLAEKALSRRTQR